MPSVTLVKSSTTFLLEKARSSVELNGIFVNGLKSASRAETFNLTLAVVMSEIKISPPLEWSRTILFESLVRVAVIPVTSLR